MEEINRELPLEGRPPCRHKANVTFLSRQSVSYESQKKGTASGPASTAVCREMPFYHTNTKDSAKGYKAWMEL